MTDPTIVADILFLTCKKNSSRISSWHQPDSDSGMVQDDESTIKVHNDAKTPFSWIWPFGIWNIIHVYTKWGERWPSGLGSRPATGRLMVRVPLR